MLRSKFGTQQDKSHSDQLLEAITGEVYAHYCVMILHVGRPLTI